ncbi:hypothetical protein Tco_0398437 [Tanacetum coccineum]
MTRSYETLCLATLKVVKIILAFLRVLDDMETSRLASLHEPEIDNLKQDRAAVVSKVIPNAAMKLVHSDDLSVLIAKLVRASIIYGRCQAFEEVAAMKEPFVLEKMPVYRPSLKEEYDQAVML